MLWQRNIRQKLEAALESSPAILLIGGRQTGKSTLVKDIGQQKGFSYVTFDDLSFLSAAKEDPHGFIHNLKKPVILDEVQRVPELFTAIKKEIDEHRAPGRYILTGSANPMLLPNISDYLVGRLALFELFPLSQGELSSVKERFIDAVFTDEVSSFLAQPLSKTELFQKIMMGGYPLVQNLNLEARYHWFDSYTTMLLYREIQEITRVTELVEFPRILRILATRVGNLLNGADLARTTNMATTTLHRYLALLEILFMITLQPPWSGNLGKRLIKAPKIYLTDTGLLSYLLAATEEKMVAHTIPMGGMLENFVVSELCKQATWSQMRVTMFHFRTSSGVEVDIILENEVGDIVALEVKASATVTAQDFKGLKYLQEEMKEKFIKGIVIYTGSHTIPFGDRLWAMPITSLWSVA